MSSLVKFGCQNCGCRRLIDKNNRLHCTACGLVFSKDSENAEERDARILYLERYEKAETCLRLSPPRFDDAEDYFRNFISKYPNQSDGYWGLVRARYGIKYEDDASGKKLPSCYKSSYADFTHDPDFIKAINLAESDFIRQNYVAEADVIAKICKEWRKEAQKYQYDIFISFKASDDLTKRPTADYADMHDLYTYLLDEKYKVFFSPMTMKQFSGMNQEPYIFNALQSAKVIIVYGSKPEYFTSTWVQNEWSRFLRMTENNEKVKGSCIVAYDGFDPGELPRELKQQYVIDASKENRTFYVDIAEKIKEIIKESGSQRVLLNQSSVSDVIRTYKNETRKQSQKEYNKAKRTAIQETTRRFISEKFKEFSEGIAQKRKENIDKIGIQRYKNNITLYVTLALMALFVLISLIDLQAFAIISAVIALSAIIANAVRRRQTKKWDDVPLKKPFVEKAIKYTTVIFLIASIYRIFFVYGVTDMIVIDGVLYACYVNEETVIIPDEVTVVMVDAFAGKLGLRGQKIKTIILPDSVEHIAYRAFANCRSLEIVHLGSGVQTIDAQVFKNCDNIQIAFYGDSPEKWKKVEIDLSDSFAFQIFEALLPDLAYKLRNPNARNEGIYAAEILYPLRYYQSQQYDNKEMSAEANYYIGFFYEYGYGVVANETTAYTYYAKSASKGYQPAKSKMGCYYYERGRYKEAVDLLTSAAKYGIPEAQYTLGLMYDKGLGVERDTKEAQKWYKKAAASGHREAKEHLDNFFDFASLFI